MAKPSRVRIQILQRLELKRFERKLASKHKAHSRRSRETRSGQRVRAEPQIKGFRPAAWRDRAVPDRLDLINNYEETVGFITEVNRCALGDGRPVRLVFKNTRLIRPEALLLLLAEIHRCRLIRGATRVTGTYPDNSRVDQMLTRTGFYQLLEVAPSTRAKQTDDDRYIRFRSNIRLVQGEARRLREDLMGAKMAMTGRARKRLYRVVTEAMLNVSQHAYPIPIPPSIKGRWWLSGEIDTQRNEFMISFCDLGVGIPATLPRLYALERIGAALSLLPGIPPNDGEMIKAAMVLGRSRTEASNRGKGLNDLRSFVDQAGEGMLNIFSQHGRYRYTASGAESAHNYEGTIGGTLIKWTTPLDKIIDWTDTDEPDSDDDFDS